MIYTYICNNWNVQVVCSADEKRVVDELLELGKLKEKKRRDFLGMVSEDADDVERARDFADNYNEMLETWVKSRVLEFASNVRDQVLKEVPNPEGAAEIAYETSFESPNCKDLLQYCLDVNAYLKKLI